MQRKAGTLTPLEVTILEMAIDLAIRGQREFHGFLLAKEIKARRGALFRTAYGPLYKALDRMEANGLLKSQWEDAAVAGQERRPRRCYYRVTASGQRALELAGQAGQEPGLKASEA